MSFCNLMVEHYKVTGQGDCDSDDKRLYLTKTKTMKLSQGLIMVYLVVFRGRSFGICFMSKWVRVYPHPLRVSFTLWRALILIIPFLFYWVHCATMKMCKIDTAHDWQLTAHITLSPGGECLGGHAQIVEGESWKLVILFCLTNFDLLFSSY